MKKFLKKLKPRTKIVGLYKLNLHIHLLTYLGVRSFKSNSIKAKLYAFLLIAPLIALCLSEIEHRYCHPPRKTNSLEKALTVVTVGSFCMVALSILHSNWKSRPSWEAMMKMLKTFDATVARTDFLEAKKKIFIGFLLIRIIPILLSVAFCVSWKIITRFPFAFHIAVPHHIATFYEFQIATFMLEFACSVECRYQHLFEHLREAVRRANENGGTDDIFRGAVAKIKHKYRLLHKAIEEINKIFTLIALCYFSHLVVFFEFHFYTILYAFSLGKNVVFGAVPFIILILVSTFF